MVERNSPHTPPSDSDSDGVRVISEARTAGQSALRWALPVLVVLGAVVVWRLLATPPPGHATAAAAAVVAAAPDTPDAQMPRRPSSLPAQATDKVPNDDRNDLANYFQPGDPEPTGAELIEALHDVGIRTGIGAFNPPGTSPPLEGLAVPEGYPLPDGYARHYQSTDGGVAIEPILMFAPDFTLYDRDGRPVAMPGNRVVPPELAPPGLPLRRVRIPPP